MTRIQCVHEPDPPWKRTRGSPAPQTRHTLVPSPHGVRILRATRARASTWAAGSIAGALWALWVGSCMGGPGADGGTRTGALGQWPLTWHGPAPPSALLPAWQGRGLGRQDRDGVGTPRLSGG